MSRRKRASTTARGYGAAHRKEREKWRPSVDAGREWCRRCYLSIPPAGVGRCPRCGRNHRGWDLGHKDGTGKRVYSGPEHMCCNRSAGASLGNKSFVRRVQATMRKQRTRTSREW